MIVVDTTVWADWFNGVDSPQVRRLAESAFAEVRKIRLWTGRTPD